MNIYDSACLTFINGVRRRISNVHAAAKHIAKYIRRGYTRRSIYSLKQRISPHIYESDMRRALLDAGFTIIDDHVDCEDLCPTHNSPFLISAANAET